VKILLINWQDPDNPQAGGAEIHLDEIYSRLANSGHEVTWLASGWRSCSPRAERRGIRVHRTGHRYTFGAASVAYYRRNFAGQPFDLVVEALNKVPIYAPLWADPPVALVVHHLFGTTAFREAPLPLAGLTWLQERPLARIYEGVRVQAISESTKGDLVSRGLNEGLIDVIYPGVDLEFFRAASSPTRSPTPTFLYLGRLRRYKRVDLVLRAFAQLLGEGVSANLVIAGQGSDARRLRGLAAELGLHEKVRFAGFVSELEKLALYQHCWANVFVSPKEGWGITNLEAAACGTATIASDSPGLRESVVHGRTGLLVPHGSVTALTAAMRRFASEPALAERLGAGAALFAGDFTWDRAARQTERHLADTLALSVDPREAR
jgi:glycosyltransferase involved in cell wall biosynthesis